MTIVGVALAVVAAVAWMPKWWRVAQREHYINGSVTATLLRWLRATPVPNLGLAALGLLAAAATILLDNGATVSIAGDVERWVAFGLSSTAVLMATLVPFGLPWRGRTSKLRFTRRMYTVAFLSAVFWSAALAVLTVALSGLSAVAICSVFGFAAIDAALLVLAPVETRLAKRYQRQAEKRLATLQPLTIAITGSYGKTSTKDHLAHLIGSMRPTVASPKSWNNQAGLCRTVNEKLNPSTEVFIAEMGTFGAGEIRAMCDWVKPSIVAITAIGPVHLERMGSIEKIVAAKMEIVEKAQTVVLNIDSPELAIAANQLSASRPDLQIIRVSATSKSSAQIKVYSNTYGNHETSEMSETSETSEMLCEYRGRTLSLGVLPASVHASNVAVAAALAAQAGAPLDQLPKRLVGLQQVGHRASVSVTPSGMTIIDNTFNSNPTGARKALAALLAHRLAEGNRTVVVTPGMIELGSRQAQENAEFARLVTESGCTLVLVGHTNRRALRRGVSQGQGTVIEVPNREAAREWVRHHLQAGDAVLWENDLPDHYA
ncbi:MAG: Mur ligase family protein [Acidimicrobiaceae bacterium]|nr:Mur ligase family protein [Acidimicrobiaceae bacterium]